MHCLERRNRTRGAVPKQCQQSTLPEAQKQMNGKCNLVDERVGGGKKGGGGVGVARVLGIE